MARCKSAAERTILIPAVKAFDMQKAARKPLEWVAIGLSAWKSRQTWKVPSMMIECKGEARYVLKRGSVETEYPTLIDATNAAEASRDEPA